MGTAWRHQTVRRRLANHAEELRFVAWGPIVPEILEAFERWPVSMWPVPRPPPLVTVSLCRSDSRRPHLSVEKGRQNVLRHAFALTVVPWTTAVSWGLAHVKGGQAVGRSVNNTIQGDATILPFAEDTAQCRQTIPFRVMRRSLRVLRILHSAEKAMQEKVRTALQAHGGKQLHLPSTTLKHNPYHEMMVVDCLGVDASALCRRCTNCCSSRPRGQPTI